MGREEIGRRRRLDGVNASGICEATDPFYAPSPDMQSVSNENFGSLIAYLVPGATALLGGSVFSPLLKTWFSFASEGAPTIGGFLYLTVASLAAGMTVSVVR